MKNKIYFIAAREETYKRNLAVDLLLSHHFQILLFRYR